MRSTSDRSRTAWNVKFTKLIFFSSKLFGKLWFIKSLLEARTLPTELPGKGKGNFGVLQLFFFTCPMGLCFLLTSMLNTTRRSERSPRFWGDTWNWQWGKNNVAVNLVFTCGEADRSRHGNCCSCCCCCQCCCCCCCCCWGNHFHFAFLLMHTHKGCENEKTFS